MSTLAFAALRCLADGRFHSGEEVARSLGRSRSALSDALKRTGDLGVALFSVPGRGYRLAQPIEFLDVAAVREALGPASRRLALEIVDETDSTNSRLLSAAAAGAPSGTCLAAEWQSAGRGRLGRAWIGALGGSLTFSLLWRFDRGAAQLAGLSLAVGVAVARALRLCGVEGAQVKWPNDVVVDFRKLSGILVETSGEIHGPSVAVIGVGINVRLEDATAERIDQPVTDIEASMPGASRNVVLARVLAELVAVLDAFERTGFGAVREAWLALHAYEGRTVRVMAPREAAYEAVVEGVAPDGALQVRRQGRLVALASAEIAFRG